MRTHVNPQQLVLRLDSATGFAKVGWAVELPLGRFIHIDLIAETPYCGPITHDSPIFADFQNACQRAREVNQPLIAAQNQDLAAKGCIPVPLDLHHSGADTAPDAFGNYHEAAMRAMFHLTANFATVWAVVNRHRIVQLRSCRPPKPMEELEYQVWKHYVLNQLAHTPGETSTGKLIVRESGLWFCPDNHENHR